MYVKKEILTRFKGSGLSKKLESKYRKFLYKKICHYDNFYLYNNFVYSRDPNLDLNLLNYLMQLLVVYAEYCKYSVTSLKK